MSAKSDLFFPSSNSGKVELPRAFVNSLKILFDILDEDSDGFVPVNEIESRWQGEGINGLPNGVLESLRQVAPKDGKLTFELFCAALRLTLQKNKERNDGKEGKQPNKAAVRPNNVHPMRSSQSAPVLRGGIGRQNGDRPPNSSDHLKIKPERKISTPLDDRNSAKYGLKGGPIVNELPRRVRHSVGDRVEISSELKNWQNDRRNRRIISPGPHPLSKSNDKTPIGSQISPRGNNGRGSRQGNSNENNYKYVRPSSSSDVKAKTHLVYPQEPIYERRAAVSVNNNNNQRASTSDKIPPTGTIKKSKRREEPRRHTLSNGVDFNELKRLKQLEQEKDILCQGLEVIDRAQEWYRQEILNVKEIQDKLGHNAQDSRLLKHEEEAAYRSARIQNVNRQLDALMTSKNGFPDHMNLVLPSKSPPGKSRESAQVGQLKEQNRQLTQEVSAKSDKITILEKEKSALIRQMFDARARQQQKEKADNSVFL